MSVAGLTGHSPPSSLALLGGLPALHASHFLCICCLSGLAHTGNKECEAWRKHSGTHNVTSRRGQRGYQGWFECGYTLYALVTPRRLHADCNRLLNGAPSLSPLGHASEIETETTSSRVGLSTRAALASHTYKACAQHDEQQEKLKKDRPPILLICL